MIDADLNLPAALDALLTEASVTGAARRLRLSPSATSRALARLRAVTGDPLLVRAGRGLVPTPLAADLRDRVHALAREARDVLSPRSRRLDLAALERDFVIRARDGFVDQLAALLVAAVAAAAPRVRLRFVSKPFKTAGPLRDGAVDLEIGTPRLPAPEVRTQLLFRDGFVGAARAGHTLLSGPVTPERYAACGHVVASRKEEFTGPVDEALAALGLRRRFVAVVPGFPDALRIARGTDLIALVPRSCLPRIAGEAPADLMGFALPFPTPEVAVSAMWHPRLDADSAQRWLRGMVGEVCRAR
jgi:DNA-binding transcriptional LysR family regulator